MLSICILLCFLVTEQAGVCPAYAQDYHLPAPGVMVHLSPPIDPPILKGIKVHPDNPFKFEFILDKGDSELNNSYSLYDYLASIVDVMAYFLHVLPLPGQLSCR